MKLKVNDGEVVFATHFIVATIPQELLVGNRATLRALQVVPEGLLCYSESERVKAESILSKLEIPFTTETITVPNSQKDKSAGLKYNSRTEAIKHLTGEIDEPESEVIPKLKREKEELRVKLNQAESALLAVMCNKPNQSGNAFLQRQYSDGNLTDADLQVAATKGFTSLADVAKINGIVNATK